MKDYYFLSPIRKEALQTLRNMNASNKGTLEVVLLFFQRKYVRPLSEATAKQIANLTFEPNTKSLSDFLEELTD